MRIRLLLACIVLIAAIPSESHSAQLQIPRTDSVALRRFVDTLASRMARRAAVAGFPLPATPRVLFDEGLLGDPRVQSEDAPKLLAGGSFPLLNRVSIPTWAGVDGAQRRAFEEFAAPFGAERFFAVFWNWLAPAHELAHIIQAHWGNGSLTINDDYDRAFEVEAFAIPIAFFRAEGAVNELSEAAALFRQVVASLAMYLPPDTIGWTPASAPDAVRRCEIWIRQKAGDLSHAEALAINKLCPYRAILDLLATSTGPDFSTIVRNVAQSNDPSKWPRNCSAAADLLVRHPIFRRELEGLSRSDLTPAYTAWRFGLVVGGIGLTRGNAELAASCGAPAAAPAEVVHRIVVLAWERLHLR